MSAIRIIIADDHPVFLAGLRSVVEIESDIEIVGEATDGSHALTLVTELRPDIAVLDIGMPKIDGIEVMTEIDRLKIPVGVIFMTMYREEKLYKRGMDLGLRGYVLKDGALSELIEAIRTVAEGDKFVSPELLSHFEDARSRSSEVKGDPEQLSASELRILSLIAEYKTSREIADELFISPRTVETHRTNICSKVGLHGRHALMKYALSRFEKSALEPKNT